MSTFLDGPFELRKIDPPNMGQPLNGIYCKGQLVATTGNYNHGAAKEMTNAVLALPELMRALKAIVKLLDGSQPIDYLGALMIAQSAIAKAIAGE